MVVRFPHRFHLCERTLRSREATPLNRFETSDQTDVPSLTLPPRDGAGLRGGEFTGIAKCRSKIMWKLFDECESREVACGGDVGFVRELLDRDPFLVFGDGEYGVSDMLYATC
ncbi:hypothetical protein ACS0TY_033187 [Phlomoides rotata]